MDFIMGKLVLWLARQACDADDGGRPAVRFEQI